MAKVDDGIIKIVLFLLLGFVVIYLLANFGMFKTAAIVSATNPDKLLGGTTQSYEIYLKAEPPLPGSLSTYKEQTGNWYLTDASDNIITRGAPIKLEGGEYNTRISVIIPTGYKSVKIYAQIIETSYENYQKVDETIKAEDVISLPVAVCNQHSDCSSEDLCLNSFGYCNAGLCEMKGECKSCSKDKDCFSSTKDYVCTNSQCVVPEQMSLIEQFTNLANDPLTEPGDVIPGQPAEPKPIPSSIYAGVFVLFIVLVIIFFKRRG